MPTRRRSTESRPKRVLLLVEFSLRDLPGCVLLKYLLERTWGYDVRLASPDVEREVVARFRPHLVIGSHLRYPASVARAGELHRMGIAVGVIHTEGTAIKEPVKQVVAGKYSDLAEVDLHFFWNQEIAAMALALHPSLAGRTHVAGNLRMDFYAQPLSRLQMTKDEFCRKYGLAPDRPIVTWASNLGWVRYEGNHAAIAELQERYHREGLATYEPWDDIAGIVRRESESRRLQADAFVELARAYPHVGFVLKTHPVEDSHWYEDLCRRAGVGNVVIVTNDYIWDVLNATSVHLHRSCTTSIEAWLMGKPTIDLLLNPDEWYFSEELAAGGDVARTVPELVERVGAYLDGAAVPAAKLTARAGVIRNWFDRADGHSAERHAEVIRDFLEARAVEPSYGPSLADARALARAALRRMLGLSVDRSLRVWSPNAYRETRGKFFTAADVEAWTERLASVLGPGAGRSARAARPLEVVDQQVAP